MLRAMADPILLLLFLLAAAGCTEPEVKPWPLRFHSVLVQQFQGEFAVIDLWYDWPGGRNLNIIREQLGGVTYDIEWNNGTSFFYDLPQKTCRTAHLPVGILRPNWMNGAEYLGVEIVDGFTCNFWRKADFITYWEDAATARPVRWIFCAGRKIDVMSFEVGAELPDSEWQAPAYCFPVSNNLSLHNQTEEKRWLSGLSCLEELIPRS